MRAAAVLLACWAIAGVTALTPADFKGKHVLLFVTDQERYTQHFPPGWEQENLPGLTRLKRNGVSFKHAYTNSCMCSAARSSLWTGFTPYQTSVHYTLETDMPDDQYNQNPMSKPYNKPGAARNAIANLAQMAQAAGYETVYKGKFHLVKPGSPTGNWTQEDLAAYGYSRWNPPDAGANQDLSEGGGNPLGGGNNDLRIMNSTGAPGSVNEGALQYIREILPKATKPVFLVVSIVNPHDVLFYPGQFTASGYDPSLLTGPILPPATANESLTEKPFAQQFYAALSIKAGFAPSPGEQQTAYVNFYANLIKQSDQYLVNTINTLEQVGLLDKTLIIRTSDHGEMGTSHGGQIQKNFNMYEEATRIPMVYSNPKLWPTPKESSALVSHIDFAPTLQTLLGVPVHRRFRTAGVDYANVVMNPETARPPQDYVMFSYNDWNAGQNSGPYVPNAAFLRGIRESEWKIVQYFSPNGGNLAPLTVQWECYNLVADPLEMRNLGYRNATLTPYERFHFERLKARLLRVTATRMAPLPGFEWDIDMSANTTGLGAGPQYQAMGGPATGKPIGTPESQMQVNWYWRGQGQARGTFWVTARTGQIVGTMHTSVTTTPNSVSYVGSAVVTGGTNAYRGFTGIRGWPLAVYMTTDATGKTGTIRLAGRVTTANVNGQLSLGPLNPFTGQ